MDQWVRDQRHITCERSCQSDEKETIPMSESSCPCPNCGGSMVMLRRDQQPAGQRDVVLAWTICLACRHVRLDHWTFVDQIVPDETSQDHQHRA